MAGPGQWYPNGSPGSGGSGDVVGPASSTDNAAARFDSTTGKNLQNSDLIVGDIGASDLTVSVSVGAGNIDIKLVPRGSGDVTASRTFRTDVGGQAFIAGASNTSYNIGINGGSNGELRMRSASNVGWTNSGNGNDALDTNVSRAAAGEVAFGNGTVGNASAKLRFGGGRCVGLTSSAGAPSVTEYPSDGDWGIHKNTTTGVSSVARNDGGAIKTAAMV